MDAVTGEIAQQRAAGFLFKGVTQVPFADVQALGYGADADVRLLIVLLNIGNGHGYIPVRAAGFGLRQRLLLWRQLGLDPLHRLFQVPVVEGLEQIVHRFQPQSRLDIGKAVVGGQNDHIGILPHSAELFQHFDAVHLGHFQIGDDEIRIAAGRLFQPLRAVGGFPHHHAVQGRPVHRQHNALADQFLVLHNQYLQHRFSSFRFRGSLARTRAPLPSGLLSRYRPNRSP